jgi:hypothetical protein
MPFPNDKLPNNPNILSSVDVLSPINDYYCSDPSAPNPLHIRALHGLHPILSELQTDHIGFYSSLKSDVLQPDYSTLCAHFDGGSMATTSSDSLHALWFFRPFDSLDPAPVPLEVADQNSTCPSALVNFFAFQALPRLALLW